MRRSLANRPVVAVRLLLSGVGVERRGRLVRNVQSNNRGKSLGRKRENMPEPEDKPFAIPKPMVWEAWRRVKANKGAPGVDGQDLEEFEADLADNLYKIWNRMSSGSYFPPPVRAVEIPKPHGSGVRMLGVPTIADRVAQTVVAMHLEQRADCRFHPDSYGYRPGKSAHEALAACRRRCWGYDWVIDLDVQEFFDTVPWDLMVKAVEAVTDARWVLLYVERWLAAPLEHPGGALEKRTKGTPQGSAVSPILANLFMHYAFDSWMVRSFPGCPFERYADDAVVHCKTRRQAQSELRRMRIHRRTDLSLDGLARWLNPIIAGWINYYGRFYRTALDPLLKRVNAYLRRWAGRKYRRLRTEKRFHGWWTGLLARRPGLFIHWRLVRSYQG